MKYIIIGLGDYGFALAGVLLVWAWRRQVAIADRKRYEQILAEI